MIPVEARGGAEAARPGAASAASERRIKPPAWFWVVCAIAVLWNALGIVTFWMDATLGAERLASLPPAERALRESVPAWATVAYGIAVFGGTSGSVALLLRRAWATPALVISLAAIVVQMSQAIFDSEMVRVLGPQSIVMPVVITAVAAALAALSAAGRRRGWIGQYTIP
jgi:hypothetical protein